MKTSILILTSLLTAAPALAVDKPNIIIFLADDLGYADLGCQGCQDIPTPHIDSIAENGVRFTDGYATHPVCSPSRAGLMSGMYQHRFGFEHNSGPERYAAPNFGLPREIPTLAEKLKEAGYATGMVGKWHIGFKAGLRPHERGFDFYYGFLSGARSYYPNSPREWDPIIRNGERVTDEKEYLTDAFARESVDFIERSKERPFFLYLAFNAVHSPLEATSEYERRFPQISDRKRKTYAGMLAAMDDAVGRVLAKVRDLGSEENTLIFFYSDNGGPTPETTSRNDPLRGFKGQMFEGGIRVPFLMQWKGTIPARQKYREMVMGFDCHATALAAANVDVSLRETNDLSRSERTTRDGVNLLPYLTGEEPGRPHEKLFWRAGQKHAARIGDWKLVQERGYAPQLFNLANDIGEQDDLADSEREKLQELQAAFAEWEEGTMPAQWIRQDAHNAELGGKLKSETAPNASITRRVGARLETAFRNADKNGDGKVTAEELPRPEIFRRFDRNGDGVIERTEIPGAGKPATGGNENVRVTEKPDLAYGDHPAQRLDLYQPEGVQNAPVMVYIHGGGWRRGDKQAVGEKVNFFCGRRWVFASLNYRLLPEGKHPVNVNDVALALAWVHDHAREYGGNPDQLFVMGHSAGAHLAALVATSEQPLQKAGKTRGILKGVIPLDTNAYDLPALIQLNDAGFHRQVFGDDPAAWKDASPSLHVAKGQGIPPFLICFSRGMQTRANPERSKYANAFAEALHAADIAAEVVDASDRNHGEINQWFGRPDDAKVTGAAVRFLNAILSGKTGGNNESEDTSLGTRVSIES